MKHFLHFSAACILMLSCTQSSTRQASNDVQPPVADSVVAQNETEQVAFIPDTILQLGDQQDSVAYFKAPDGQIYRVTMEATESQMRSASAMNCDTNIFMGIDRYIAKTTKLSNAFIPYATINAFRATLPADSLMRNHNPAITSDSASVRVIEEKRNVSINACYLYAIKRESDNDYHMIVAHDTTPTTSELFNIEISGLPVATSTSYNTLKAVRDSVEKHFGKLCKSSYTIFTPPLKLLVKGSLFYDIDHAPGIVGPLGYRPNTSWEIHPVTKIAFK